MCADHDFNTTSLTATFPANTTKTKVRVTMTNDNIVEGHEIFNINLNVPSSLAPGIVAGSVTRVIATYTVIIHS